MRILLLGLISMLAPACDNMPQAGLHGMSMSHDDGAILGLVAEAGVVEWLTATGDVRTGDARTTTVSSIATGQTFNPFQSRVALRNGATAWLDYDPASTPPNCSPACEPMVAAIELADGAGTRSLDSAQPSPSALVLDESTAYWIRGSGNAQELVGAPIGGGSSTTLATGGGITGLAARSGAAYISFDDGRIVRVTSTATSTIVSNENQPFALFVDENSAYWVTVDGTQPAMGSIREMSIVGGTPITLATTSHAPSQLVGDGAHLYWTEGTVVRRVAIDGRTPAETIVYAPSSGTANHRIDFVAVDDMRLYWDVYGVVDGTQLLFAIKP